jgi:hypothetical protein
MSDQKTEASSERDSIQIPFHLPFKSYNVSIPMIMTFAYRPRTFLINESAQIYIASCV